MATQRDMQRTPDDHPDAGDQREEDDLPVTGAGNEDNADVPGTNRTTMCRTRKRRRSRRLVTLPRTNRQRRTSHRAQGACTCYTQAMKEICRMGKIREDLWMSGRRCTERS